MQEVVAASMQANDTKKMAHKSYMLRSNTIRDRQNQGTAAATTVISLRPKSSTNICTNDPVIYPNEMNMSRMAMSSSVSPYLVTFYFI